MKRIRKIHNLLLKNKLTVAVAESCTGGLLSGLLTDLSGSSKYFKLGTVTYSNNAKEKILKIPHHLIAKHGAVSPQIAKLMAINIRKIADTDFGLGVTGIAGPTGATYKKAVGTVFIALSKNNKTLVEKFNFRGKRNQVRKQASLAALGLLEEYI